VNDKWWTENNMGGGTVKKLSDDTYTTCQCQYECIRRHATGMTMTDIGENGACWCHYDWNDDTKSQLDKHRTLQFPCTRGMAPGKGNGANVKQPNQMSACECANHCLKNGAEGYAIPANAGEKSDCYCAATMSGRDDDPNFRSKYLTPYKRTAWSINVDNDRNADDNGWQEYIGEMYRVECVDRCISLGANGATFGKEKAEGEVGSCYCDYGVIRTRAYNTWDSLRWFADVDKYVDPEI